MDITEQDKVIIWVALSNQITFYDNYLQVNELDQEEKEMVHFLIERSLTLLDLYAPSPSDPGTISRPTF